MTALRKCCLKSSSNYKYSALDVRRIVYFVIISSVIKTLERGFLPAGSLGLTWFCFTEWSAVSSAVSLWPECVYICVWMWAGCALGRQSEGPGGFSLGDHKLLELLKHISHRQTPSITLLRENTQEKEKGEERVYSMEERETAAWL